MAKELWFYNGSVWNDATEIWFYDGTDWQEATEGYVYDGANWQLFWEGAAPPTFTNAYLFRRRSSTPCAATFCDSCVYWTIADGQSGDVIDIARSKAGGTYTTWTTGVAYNTDNGTCSDYSMTGDEWDTGTAACERATNSLQQRLTLFRSSVQQDEDFTGTLTCCNCGNGV